MSTPFSWKMLILVLTNFTSILLWMHKEVNTSIQVTLYAFFFSMRLLSPNKLNIISEDNLKMFAFLSWRDKVLCISDKVGTWAQCSYCRADDTGNSQRCLYNGNISCCISMTSYLLSRGTQFYYNLFFYFYFFLP